MQKVPFSIYTVSRPVKIVFLIDQDAPEALTQIGGCIEYCSTIWGGRYNPIIWAKKDSVDEASWQFLKAYDPDIIYSFVDFDDFLLGELNQAFNPFHFQKHLDPDRPALVELSYSKHPVKIWPLLNNVREAERVHKPILINFNLNKTTIGKNGAVCHYLGDGPVWQFLKISLGCHTQSGPVTASYSGDIRTYQVVDIEDLKQALAEIAELGNFTFLNQIIALSGPNHECNYRDQEHDFLVVIGDSPEDLAYFWNSIHLRNDHHKTKCYGLWLPTAFFEYPDLLSSIDQIVNKLSGHYYGRDERVKIISLSLSKEELSELAESFKVIHHYKTVEVYDAPRIPTFEKLNIQRFIPEPYTLNRFTEYDGFLTYEPAKFIEHLSNRQREAWMVDVYLEFDKDDGISIQGKYDWWRFPKNNMLASSLFYGESGTRMTDEHLPSVFIEGHRRHFKFQLLSEHEIFRYLLSGAKPDNFNLDKRRSFRSPVFENNVSPMGQYMSGFIELFGGFLAAVSYLEKPYWRRIFNRFTRQDPKKLSNLFEETKNRIKKSTKNEKFNNDELTIGRLTHLVLDQSKKLAYDSKSLPIDELIKEIETEVADALAGGQESIHLFSDNTQAAYRAELEQQIHDLLKMNVLFMGVSQKCKACGHVNWYKIDDLKQFSRCQGCFAEVCIKPEAKYTYRLNTLIETGYRFCLTPVLLALHTIWQQYPCSSFYYSVCRDIRYAGNKQDLTDLDLICIKDGKLIIGEVKESIELFSDKDFSAMLEVSGNLRPDYLYFTALNGQPNELIKKNIETLSKELASLGVKVAWLPLSEQYKQPDPPYLWSLDT